MDSAQVHDSRAGWTDAVPDATIQLEDASFDLGRYLDKLDLDPAELAEVNDRLNTIQRMLNKYGDPITTTLNPRAVAFGTSAA